MTPPLILRLAGNTQAYLKVQHDGLQDKHDVRRFTYNYGNEVAVSGPIAYWKFNSIDGATSWPDEIGNFNLTGYRYYETEEDPYYDDWEVSGITALSGKVQGNTVKVEGDFNDWRKVLSSASIVRYELDPPYWPYAIPDPQTRNSDLSNGFTITGWWYPHKDNTGGTGDYFRDTIFWFATDSNPTTIRLDFNRWWVMRYGMTIDINGAAIIFTGEGVISEDAWHFIVCWYSPTEEKVYLQIDNNTPYSGDLASLGTWTKEAVCFGDTYDTRAGNPTFHFDYDEWSFWNRVLTEAERTILWNSGNGKELTQSGDSWIIE